MKIIESVRAYFDRCPLLDEEARIHIDYLGSEAVEYGIYAEPVDPIVKKYVDGGSLKQFTFTFTTINFYSPELMLQLENSGFYDDFAEWIEENNKKATLPTLKDGKLPIKIEVLTNGFLMDADADRAKYQIQLRLLYKEEF